MMDGVSTMDTGSNSVLLQMTVESIAEVKVLVSNYQAEYGRSSGLQITAVTKSGTNRFRGSLYDVERNSDWNANTQDQHPQRRSEDRLEAARLGLLDRRPDRQAGRQQQAVLLLQPGVHAARGGQRRAALPRADGARAGRATSRRPTTTTATRIRSSAIRRSARPARRGNTGGCFADGGVLGKIPANRLYQTGLNILNMFPMPTIHNAAGLAYNYENHPADRERPGVAAGGPRRLPAVAVAARDVQVLRLGAAQSGVQRLDPRLQRHEAAESQGHGDCGDGQLHA